MACERCWASFPQGVGSTGNAAFVAVAVVALGVGSVTMLMQAKWLAGVANNAATALDGAPEYVAAAWRRKHMTCEANGILADAAGWGLPSF